MIDRPEAARVHVALDALAFGPRPAGVGRYVSTLLAGFAALAAPRPRLLVFARPELGRALAAAAPEGTGFAGPGVFFARPPLRLLWEQLVLGQAARGLGANLLHGLMGVVPLRSRLPSVVTIHDATFLSHPEFHQPAKVLYFGAMLARSARAARRVLTDSEASRAALVEHVGVSPDKIDVVPLAVAPLFHAPGPGAIVSARRRYGLERPFVLHAGVLEPRKNLPRLIAAIRRLNAQGYPQVLALAGAPGWGLRAIERAIAAAGPLVVRLGFVPDEDLAALYAAADAFVYVPLVEGFGLPVAEAMAAGAPVLTSNCSSLPEVAGGAARLVDPGDESAIAEGLRALLDDGAERGRLIARGHARARALSPEALARGTLEAWQRALGA